MDRYPLRVNRNTRRILDLFDEAGIKATFFFVGWVADKFPGLVKETAARGHELACHSYWHRLVYSLDPEEFRTTRAVPRTSSNRPAAPCPSVIARPVGP